MMKRHAALVLLVLSLTTLSASLTTLSAEQLRYRYREGEKYRILGTVDEQVFVNGGPSHRADILNKIAVHVQKVDGASGFLEGHHQTSERSFGQTTSYQWEEEYVTRFWRDGFGKMEIEPRYFVPVVRDVPIFPERDLQPGDSWAAPAEEVQDFRRGLGIRDPFRVPIQVQYTYRGKEQVDGKDLDVIHIRMNVFHRPFVPVEEQIYPVLVTGYAQQVFYWDNDLGLPHSYTDEFDFIYEFSTGDRMEFVGTSEGKVLLSPAMDRKKVADDIRRSLEEEGVRDAAVTEAERGVTITLQNIQFPPDSAVLLPAEREKIRRIAEILRKYPDRDIMITGHTALAGTEEGRMQLSAERARAVGDFLLSIGVSRPERLVIRGLGATEPLSDNHSEEGRHRNRRVEITILEN